MANCDRSETKLDSLEGLPPSAKVVYETLDLNGSLNQVALSEESRLAPRTIRDAVRRLEDRNLITSRTCLTDARMRVYSLQTE